MYVMGIDFGTGNSVLAEWVGAKASVFRGIGEDGSTRSDVVVGDGDEVFTDPLLLLDPPVKGKVENSIKRRMILALEQGDLETVAYLKKLAAARLKYIYNAYSNAAEEQVVKTVLTCPANTGQAYRSVLLDIGRQIGLPSVDIVDEPTAAAVHHGLSEVAKQNERWMVVDWGCGTCDVSLIERTVGSRDLKVVCVKGDNSLGGIDMDHLLTGFLAEKYGFASDEARMYSVESLKKQLSSNTEAEEEILLANGTIVKATCSREELENVVQPLLTRGKELIEDALVSVGWGDVDRVIATGGPFIMPCVRNMIGDATERDESELLCRDPLSSVALGAARLAEIKRVGGLVVTNKVAKSIGVRVVEGNNEDTYHLIIHRGEDRPVRRGVTLATSVDLQDIIEIEIREGDNKVSSQSNTLLARLNAVVRPDNRGAIRLHLQVALSDGGDMEAYIEPMDGENTVRDVQALGIRLTKGQKETATGELRTGDPLQEFNSQVYERETDPDTARQVYERLKLKYHPDRDPGRREHWNTRLSAMDDAFGTYLAEVERRMRASTVPNLDWDEPAKLQNLVVDEVLSHRLTHCLANAIGTEEQLELMPELLRRYPDYRRVMASYLFGIKRNTVLQQMLAEDERPHVGLVVLLQNIPGKPIRERHEVLKAAYRVKESKVRDVLLNPHLDMETLYVEVPAVADAPVNPMGGAQTKNQQSRKTGEASVKLKNGVVLHITYERDWSWIYDGFEGLDDTLKKAGFFYSGKRAAWYAKRHVNPEEF